MARALRRRTDGARILVVEDSEDFLLLLQLALQDAGYGVDCATCAEDALAMLETQRYQLLLCDYSLPGYSGLWLLRRTFEHGLMQPATALMVTGDPEAPGVRDITNVVAKPVDFDQFLLRIRALLGRDSHDPSSSDVAA